MRLVSSTALICAALSVVLLGVRVDGAISFAEPLQVVTSGWEQESLVALWEWLNGGAIYVSRLDIPYRWSIYNWLFYVGYGAGIEAVVGPLSLSDAWIPTVGRLLTLGAVTAGVVLAYHSFVAVLGHREPHPRPLTFAFSVLVVAGPLVGFWAVTTRPDVGALILEIAAVAAYWRLQGRRPVAAVLVFCVLAYAAWAFKQTAIVTAVGLGLYLLARRRWTPMFVLAGTMATAWGATLTVGSPEYVKSILMADDKAVFSAAHGVSVFVNFASKFVPGLLGAAAIILLLARSGRLAAAWRDNEALVFAATGTLAGVVLVAATTPRVGSSESYYFIVAYFVALFVLAGLRSLATEGTNHRLALGALSLGWVVQGLAVLAVLGGLAGVLSVRPIHEHMIRNKICLDTLPRPLYVADIYLSLPWMTPGTPPFVLGYGYQTLRAAGRTMERGGIGGLIEEGYFAALALPLTTKDIFDGGGLDGYRRAPADCPAFKVFLRTAPPSDKIGG
jgi:hypothetical protein